MPFKPTAPKRPWISTAVAKAPQEGRKESNRAIYATNRWRVFSEQYREKNPFCVKCLEQGVFTDCRKGQKARGQADHILPINQGGAIWDESNLRTLCYRCHSKVSAKRNKE